MVLVTETTYKARIMVVEDEALVRQDLEEFLVEMGYEIAAAADTGESAIEKAVAVKPDLIFMDINLKGELDGIEAAERITRIMFVPVIYLTAFSDAQTQERLKNTAPFGYVLKPFDERELRTGIELALQRASFERELEERRRWFETTLRSIADGVVTTDNFGKITYLNPAAEKLLGISFETAVGRDVREVMKFFNEFSGQKIENPAAVALRKRKTIFLPSDSMLAREDGENLPVDDSAALILDENDNPLGVVVVFHDNSEHRKYVKQLVEAKRMEAVGILAGGIAHNFNNMMLGAMGNLEMIRRSGLDETNAHRLTTAYDACRKASELTRKLLAFARGQTLQPVNVELNDTVRGIENLCMSLIKEAAQLSLNLCEQKVLVKVDPVNLEQAILNLILNSIAAMPNGGALTIETKYQAFDESDTDCTGAPIPFGMYAGVGVTDTGIGMDAETMSKIFVPFFTTKGEHHGTGLGLASVEGFVKQSGGFITVASEPGKGTSIFLYFPKVDD